MKTAVVIFSRNAVRQGKWETVLQSYAMQKFPCSLHLLADSESSDSTVEQAQKSNWEILNIKAGKFNHGLTRQLVADKLIAENFDAAIFATQDVVLESENTLQILLDALVKENAAAAYARQLPIKESGMDSYFRYRNYPEKSRVKSKKDISELGLMTCFCSDSLAIWDLHKLKAAGGFPETMFGEDILMAGRLILNGEKIVYCAESRCIHGHNNSIKEIFRRGYDIGRLHKQYPELQQNFGSLESCAKNHIPLSRKLQYLFPLAIKYLALKLGSF